MEDYRFEPRKREYLLFLGRIAPAKGTHVAIDVARETGLPLKIAGEIQPLFREYWDREVAPHVDGRQIEYVGEADFAAKNELLAGARAMLFPIQWDEPFGLVVIEAMACGTPVLALPGGSMPEIVRDGVNGYLCADAGEMARRASHLDIDPARCREYVRTHFSLDAMVRRYEALFLEVIGAAVASRRRARQASPRTRQRREAAAVLAVRARIRPEIAVDDVIQYQDQFYILATSSLLQERRHVLKDGDSFAVFDTQGDVAPFGAGEQGYFHGGTRHLSMLRQTINGQRPLLLSSRVREQNDLFGADLTNPDQVRDGVVFFPRDLLHIYRSRFLWEGHWYERLRIANYGLATISATLMMEFGADYADIFEVRGLKRERRGTMLPPSVDCGRRCGSPTRGSTARCAPPCCCSIRRPRSMSGDRVRYHVELAPHQAQHPDADDPVRGPGGPRPHAVLRRGVPKRPPEAVRAAAGDGAPCSPPTSSSTSGATGRPPTSR